MLCGPGAFSDVTKVNYATLLRAMAKEDLLTQEASGLLMVGGKGERMVSHFSFYAVFETPKEWRVLHDGRPLGTLSPHQPPIQGDFLIFAGRRWRIALVDLEAEVIEVVPAPAGKLPTFEPNQPPTSTDARDEMVAVYESTEAEPWLDATAQDLLSQARNAWRRADLTHRVTVESGANLIVFPWVGDLALATTRLILLTQGIEAEADGPALTCKQATKLELQAVAGQVLSGPLPTASELAARLGPFRVDKWDWVLNDELLTQANAARCIDMEGALVALRRIRGDAYRAGA